MPSPAAPSETRRRRLLPATRNQHDAEILRLAVPAFGALVAEPLFLLADSAIVGRLGTAPLGGLGVAGQALTTLVGVSIFLAYGTTAAVARQLGAGNRRAAVRQGIDGLWLAAIIGAVVIAACWPMSPSIAGAFGGSAEVTRQAAIYLRISLLGAPSMLIVLAGTGVLRGLQDTRTPLVVAVAANLVNVTLNAVLVLGLRWGIAGSAWGTVLAQTAAAAAYLAMVARGARRAGVSFAPDLAGLRAAAATGASLVVRTLALQAVLIVVTAIAARQGNAAIAAHQIAFRAWTLLAYALDAIAIAGQAITGRYLGAGDVAGARAATNRMIGWGAIYGVVFAVILVAAIPVLPGIFAAAPDVHRLLPVVLLVAAAQQPVAGVVFVLDGVLIGAGDQDYLALAGLAAAAVFGLAAAVVVTLHGGLVALWLAVSLWLLARFVTLTLRARGSRWLVTGAVRKDRRSRDKKW
ncbi:MAG TPA: MATE family efflux transporter [Streptosporangiaceae bacterium]|nr:MATE family efflux transporter [Streptosporangiaceae bacterium]